MKGKIIILLIMIGIGVVLVLSWFLVGQNKERVIQVGLVNNTLLENRQSADKNLDSDKDGLPDWQEVFYGTDPKNSDSDGDGTLDGKEVELRRNPLKPGPDDKIAVIFAQSESFKDTKTKEPDKPLTPDSNFTDYLAGLIVKEMSIDLNDPDDITQGGKLSVLSEEQVISRVETNLDFFSNQFGLSEEFISDEELTVIQDNSPEAVANYLSQILSLLSAQFPSYINDIKNGRADEDVFLRGFGEIIVGLKNGDTSKLTRTIAAYYETAIALKEIPVPSSWLVLHKEGINLFLASKNILEAIENFETDPLKAMVALNKMEDLIDEAILYFDAGIKKFNELSNRL